MKAIQKKKFENTSNDCANVSKEVKRLRNEFGFTARVLINLTSEG